MATAANITEATLQIIIDPSVQSDWEKVLQEFQLLGILYSLKPIGAGRIEIPPNGGVLLLCSSDFKTAPKMENTISRIADFMAAVPNGVVLFEGFSRLGEKKRGATRAALMASYSSGDGRIFGLIPTRKPQDTALCIRSIAKREQIEDNPPVLARPKSKSGLVAGAQQHLIEGLLNCGAVKAQELLEALGCPQAVFDAIMQDPSIILDIKGFGEKFVSQNRELLGKLLK